MLSKIVWVSRRQSHLAFIREAQCTVELMMATDIMYAVCWYVEVDMIVHGTVDQETVYHMYVHRYLRSAVRQCGT